MDLKTIQADMIKAMKEKDKVTKDAISGLIAAVKKVAIDEGVRDNITEELTDRVILKELKSVKEQIDTCPQDREDLINQYKTTYEIISKYAPKLLSADEIKAIITEKFSDILSSGNKGLIMKNVMAELKGKADGKLINEIVAELTK